VAIRLRWLGYACFEIVLPSGKVLVTDPFIDYSNTAPIKAAEVTGADYIAITHTHFDHCTDLGYLVEKFNSKVICAYQSAGLLLEYFGFKWTNLVRVRAGDNLVFNDLKVEAKRAEHIFLPITKEQELEMDFKAPLNKMMPSMISANLHQMPVRDMEMINYVFQTSDNLRILIFGGLTAEYQRHEIAQTKPNVVIIQAGNAPAVAEFASLSGAEWVIPYHHDSKKEETHQKAQEIALQLASRSKANFLDIQPGKWYQIGVCIS
jgi:L-ascorbate metabolism protein UlaG (beta-lactamase superfamily)